MRTNIQTRMGYSCQRRWSSGVGAARRKGRQVLLGGIVATAFCSPARAIPVPPVPFSHHDSAQMHKVIEGLEQDWRQAILSANLQAIDHLLADDYLGVTANGTLETKADLLAMRRSGTVKFSQLDLSDLKVRVYGDTAVVTSKAEVAGSNGGTDISGRYRYTRVYNRRDGQWRIVSFEASRIAEGRKH